MPIAESFAFRKRRVEENLRRVRKVTLVLIGVIFLFAILNISALLLGTLQTTSLYLALAYVAFFTLNVVTCFIVTSEKSVDLNDEGDLARYERVVSIYVFTLMTIGALISLFDQEEYKHLMVFTMLVLVCSSFIVISRRQLAISLGFSTIILAIGLPFFVKDQQQLPGFYQHIMSYVPVAYAISRVLHRMYVRNYESHVQLEQEIEKNSSLNEQLREANQRLEALALSDELTGVANLRGLATFLEEHVKTRGATSLAIIVIDIDYFKEYNDLHGHWKGDEVLSQVARMLSRIARENSDFISRWGGEEFVYVSLGKNPEEIIDRCKEIHHQISKLRIPHKGSVVSSYVTLSQGACTTLAHDMEDVRACIQQADIAMYATKKRGRNGYTYLPYPEHNNTFSALN